MLTAGSGRIQVDGTVNGNHAVVLNTTGVADLNGRIGGGTPVASLTTDAGGTTLLGANVRAQGGTITFNDVVSLDAGPVTITDTGGTGVVFGSTVDGAQDLTLAVSGATTFAGAVALGDGMGVSLTINSSGSTKFQSTVSTASGISQSDGAGVVTFQENVTVGTDDTASIFNGDVVLDGMTFTSAGPVTFGSAGAGQVTLSGGAVKIDTTGALTVNAAVDGAQNLELAGAGGAVFHAPVGGSQALWDGTGASLLLNKTGDVAFAQAVRTNQGITQGTGAATVTFGGDVEILGSGGGTFNGNVVLDGITFTSAGPVTFGNAGGDLLTIPEAAIVSTAASNSAVQINAATTLNANLMVEGGAGRIQVDGTVDGGHALTLNTTGTTDLNGSIGGTTPVASLTTNAGGTTEISANVRSNGNTQTYNDAVVLNGDVTFTEENASGAVLFNGTVRSDGTGRAVVLAGAGRKEFNRGVGSTTAGEKLRSITQNDDSGEVTFREDVYLGGGGATFRGDVVLDGMTLKSAGPVTFGNSASDRVRPFGGPVGIDTSQDGQPVTFNSPVDGEPALTVDSRNGSTGGGAVAFKAAVGAETPLTGLTVDARSATFDGTVRVGDQGLTVTATDTVDFADTVDAGGRVHLEAGGNITTNGVNSATDNIEIRSTGEGFDFAVHPEGPVIAINGSVVATQGGVSLVSDKGAININPGDAPTLNITGYSDDDPGKPAVKRIGVGLDLDPSDGTEPGVAAIVIAGRQSLTLGPKVILTAKGQYYSGAGAHDDRIPLNLRHEEEKTKLEGRTTLGDRLDVAIYLKAGGKVTVAASGPSVKPAAVDREADVTISSTKIWVTPSDQQGGQIGTLVVDAADTVTFRTFKKGPPPEFLEFEGSLQSGESNLGRIEVVSRMSPADLSTIKAWGTLPHAENLYDIHGWASFRSVDYQRYFSEPSGDYGIYLLRAGDASTLLPPFPVVAFQEPPRVPAIVMVDVTERVPPPEHRSIKDIAGEITIPHPDCMSEDLKDATKCQTIENLLAVDQTLVDGVGTQIENLDSCLLPAYETPEERKNRMTRLEELAANQRLVNSRNIGEIAIEAKNSPGLHEWMENGVAYVAIWHTRLHRPIREASDRFMRAYVETNRPTQAFLRNYIEVRLAQDLAVGSVKEGK
jgi:hypothetical protein